MTPTTPGTALDTRTTEKTSGTKAWLWSQQRQRVMEGARHLKAQSCESYERLAMSAMDSDAGVPRCCTCRGVLVRVRCSGLACPVVRVQCSAVRAVP